MEIPQRGKRSNEMQTWKDGPHSKMCLGWPLVVREWKSIYLFVFFTHISSDVDWDLNQQPFGSRALLF